MAHSIKDQVAVIGVGCIKFGDNFDQGYEEMAVEAAFAAFNDAKITSEEIDAANASMYVSIRPRGRLHLPKGACGEGSSHLKQTINLVAQRRMLLSFQLQP